MDLVKESWWCWVGAQSRKESHIHIGLLMKISITNFGFFFLFYYISAYIYFSYHLHFLLNIQFLDEYEKHEWKLYAPAKSNANNQSA
jgi:hypothetical protein